MLAVARKNKIRDIVLEKKSGTVVELAKIFKVSEETIRRDLKQLEEEGVLVRTHGGAYVQDSVEHEVDVNIRQGLLVEDKRRIAKKCAEFIANGDSVFLDSSTTAYAICDEILNREITVLTNSLKVINKLAEQSKMRLYCTGGEISRNTQSFLGRSALKSLAMFHFDKAFISCDSLNMEFGMMDASERQADIRELAASLASRFYLIVDHTKFNTTNFIQIGNLANAKGVIVDCPLDEEWKKHLEESNIPLYECGQGVS